MSSDECNTFGEGACIVIKRSYPAKELTENKTKIFEVSTGMYAGTIGRAV